MNEKPQELAGLVDAPELAARLGVSLATIRSWRKRGAPWLPAPIGKLEGLVWRAEDLVGIEERMVVKGNSPAGELEGEQRRAKGAYYTPNQAADVLAKWIVRRRGERYLEPSFGDGAFVRAVNSVAESKFLERPNWIAYELDQKVASNAVQSGLLMEEEVLVRDYLGDQEYQLVDAVIANPPFVRLRNLSKAQAESAQAANMAVTGSHMASSGSVWMPFLAKMTTTLVRRGRMAVVLPLDFTYVAYARSMWGFLADRFSSLRVVRIHERVFPEINQDVMILLADGYGGNTDFLGFEAYDSVHGFGEQGPGTLSSISIEEILKGERAFQLALLKPELRELIRSDFGGKLELASKSGNFRIGYVAGDKYFFHPSSDAIRQFDLPPKSLHPALINARKMRGHGLRTSCMGGDVFDYLWLPAEDLSPGENLYVKHGVDSGVSTGYKCAIRKPWFVVPGAKKPDAILTVFSENPLLVINDAGWFASNSLLCFYLTEGDISEFVQKWYTPLTLLSIGLQVHSLGGGVMVMVPNEAASVRIPKLVSSGARIEAIESNLSQGNILGAYSSGEKDVERLIGPEALSLVYEGIKTLEHWRSR